MLLYKYKEKETTVETYQFFCLLGFIWLAFGLTGGTAYAWHQNFELSEYDRHDKHVLVSLTYMLLGPLGLGIWLSQKD